MCSEYGLPAFTRSAINPWIIAAVACNGTPNPTEATGHKMFCKFFKLPGNKYFA